MNNPLVVANALWRKMRQRMLAEIEAQASLGWLHSLSLILWRGDESLAKALSLARRLDHTLYDCAYLALAQHVDARVVTADRRFWNKTQQNDDLRGPVVMLEVYGPDLSRRA